MERLLAMGFAEDWAKIALRRTKGNVDEAIAFCIDSGALETVTSNTSSSLPVAPQQSSGRSGDKKKKKSIWPFGSKKGSGSGSGVEGSGGEKSSLQPPQQQQQQQQEQDEEDYSVERFPSSELPSYDDYASSSPLASHKHQL
jgi:hypothetical protein